MDRPLADALGSVLDAARAQLAEWIEEGVEVYAAMASAPAGRRTAGGEAGPTRTSRAGGGREALGDRVAGTAAPLASARGASPVPRATTAPLFAPSGSSERPTLEAVRAALGDCTRCRLAAGRTHIVFGDGDPAADLMFVGEGPGEQEDRQGLPFVGRAGELLTQMIERGLGIPRRSVYICNIVKCRPPNNRTPLADEVQACRGFLDGQIDAVRPKVIVALGKPATSLLLGHDVAITRVRGIFQDYRGYAVMPTFHPAFVLRQYTPENRRLVWEDLKAALARARELGAAGDG